MSNLAKTSNSTIQIKNFEDLSRVSNLFHQANIFKDASTAAVVAVKIIAGQALGLDPFTSISQLYLVNGKPVLSSGLQARLLTDSGRYDYDIVEHTDKVCTIKIWKLRGKDWHEKGVVSFTWEDAEKAKLTGKDVWKQYPKNMLFSRAITNAIRWLAPDALSQTVYTPDELGLPVTMDSDGNDTYQPPTQVETPSTSLPYRTLEEAIVWAQGQGIEEAEAEQILDKLTEPKKAIPFYYEIQKKIKERQEPIDV